VTNANNPTARELPFEEMLQNAMSAIADGFAASGDLAAAFSRYTNEFFIPYLISTAYFQDVEQHRIRHADIKETADAYQRLFHFNLSLWTRAMKGAVDSFSRYLSVEGRRTFQTMAELGSGDTRALAAFMRRKAELAETLARRYPEAIDAIAPEYGLHAEDTQIVKVDETDRFILYQVLPTDSNVEVRNGGRPVLIIPPYVLGANILSFLPGEKRSYVHCFANQGVPTYIRVLKRIEESEALQTMTGEDDANDTRRFAEEIHRRHGIGMTLNGYCQGGFSSLCNLLSGRLDGLVDVFITCVAPMDGTRSKGLSGFLNDLPARFNDLDYGAKTLSNGNTVADGKLMGWVYKLKSIETESPVPAFLRDLLMFVRQPDGQLSIGKTAAALNYWLNYERFDLPLAITKMSFASYNTPITEDGILPVTLFGQKLDIHRIAEMRIPWLICHGESDDLVEPEVALAPLDFVEAEVSAFPKGHVAIATSWSHPDSACALHTRFGEKQYRGPVRFHLDLER
jgi:hypothetical protein